MYNKAGLFLYRGASEDPIVSLKLVVKTKIPDPSRYRSPVFQSWKSSFLDRSLSASTRVGTLIVATIYLQLIQNRYMFRSFTVLQYTHQHCVQPVVSDVEVVGYL